MAHYAFLDDQNIVVDVIVGIDETEMIEGLDTETWYGNFRGQLCKRTSYNTVNGVHVFGGTPFRKNYAGIGWKYDSDRDAFIEPKVFQSWLLNEETCSWDPPIPRPEGEGFYYWDEENLEWVETTLP